MTGKDKLFDTPRPAAPFKFDASVADVFPDMISRSVPGYHEILAMIGVMTRHFVTPGSRCYDLGCSLGAATLAMRHHIASPDVAIVAVDNSAAMVDRCRQIIVRDTSTIPVEVRLADVREVQIDNASLSILAYTLQFLALEDRLPLLRRIAAGTQSGGALVLAEKVVFSDAEQESLLSDLHYTFKRANGYSELEIAQKRQALENVLIRDSIDTHLARLREAGFAQAHVWFQSLNFVAMVAIR